MEKGYVKYEEQLKSYSRLKLIEYSVLMLAILFLLFIPCFECWKIENENLHLKSRSFSIFDELVAIADILAEKDYLTTVGFDKILFIGLIAVLVIVMLCLIILLVKTASSLGEKGKAVASSEEELSLIFNGIVGGREEQLCQATKSRIITAIVGIILCVAFGLICHIALEYYWRIVGNFGELFCTFTGFNASVLLIAIAIIAYFALSSVTKGMQRDLRERILKDRAEH